MIELDEKQIKDLEWLLENICEVEWEGDDEDRYLIIEGW